MTIRHTFVDQEGNAHPDAGVAFLRSTTPNTDTYGRQELFTESGVNQFAPTDADAIATIIDHPMYLIVEPIEELEYLKPTVTGTPRTRTLVSPKLRAKLVFPFLREQGMRALQSVAQHPGDQYVCLTNAISRAYNNRPFGVYDAGVLTHSDYSNLLPSSLYRYNAISGSATLQPQPSGSVNPLKLDLEPNDTERAVVSSNYRISNYDLSRVLVPIDGSKPVLRVQVYRPAGTGSGYDPYLNTNVTFKIFRWNTNSPNAALAAAQATQFFSDDTYSGTADEVYDGGSAVETTAQNSGVIREVTPASFDITMNTSATGGFLLIQYGITTLVDDSNASAWSAMKLFGGTLPLLLGTKFRVANQPKIRNLTGSNPPFGQGFTAELDIFATITQAEAALWRQP